MFKVFEVPRWSWTGVRRGKNPTHFEESEACESSAAIEFDRIRAGTWLNGASLSAPTTRAAPAAGAGRSGRGSNFNDASVGDATVFSPDRRVACRVKKQFVARLYGGPKNEHGHASPDCRMKSRRYALRSDRRRTVQTSTVRRRRRRRPMTRRRRRRRRDEPSSCPRFRWVHGGSARLTKDEPSLHTCGEF
jgi:hypothetical protein